MNEKRYGDSGPWEQMENGQKEIQVHPTGTGSVFMQYSHYYPMRGGGIAAHRVRCPVEWRQVRHPVC